MKYPILLLLILQSTVSCVKKQSSLNQPSQSPNSRDFQYGEYYYYSTSKKDSAFIYFNEVTKTSKDSLLIATSYGYLAEMQFEVGDFVGVQESALAAIPLVDGSQDSAQRYCIASLYNNLGRRDVGLKNYDQAIEYYNRAVKAVPNISYQNIYRNNIAVALREKGNYQEALDSFLSIQESPGEEKSAYARRITNIASLRWKLDQNFNPLPDLYSALEIRRRDKDENGMTASYNHLAAYYQKSNFDSALYYAKKMYTTAQKINSADDRLDALEKLIALSPSSESKTLFEEYHHLSDSLQTAQNAAKNQFAMIRYDSEKNKTENLKLREENTQKQLQLLRQQILTYGSIIAALSIIGLAIWRYRKKRQQTKLEAQAAIQENQLKISQRIHDTVANGLYRIMSEIEHKESVDKEPLLDKIEVLYERSRDISYEPVEKEKNTALQISQLLTSFATPDTKISVVGNNEDLWQGIPSMIVKELEQVLQELMVNMKKHSGAHHVVLQFSKSNNHLDISYKDDGKGFPANFSKGNGLKSTGNRINRIGGKITFAEETATGADIKILIPILSNDQKSINS